MERVALNTYREGCAQHDCCKANNAGHVSSALRCVRLHVCERSAFFSRTRLHRCTGCRSNGLYLVHCRHTLSSLNPEGSAANVVSVSRTEQIVLVVVVVVVVVVVLVVVELCCFG